MYRLLRSTQLALDLAAPVEDAPAPFYHDDLLCLVTSAAAHQVAPVDPDTRVVALPAVRPQYTQLWVLLAERRRRLQVHQVLDARWLVLRIVRFQLKVVAVPSGQALALRVHRVARRIARYGVARTPDAVRVAHHNARCAVETVLQVVADLTEGRQPHPARLHRTRARHAVALALLSHLRRHVL